METTWALGVLIFLSIIVIVVLYLSKKYKKKNSQLKLKLIRCRNIDHDFILIDQTIVGDDNDNQTYQLFRCTTCHAEKEIMISVSIGQPKRYLKVIS